MDVLNAEITRLKAEVSGSELIDWSAELPENLKEVQNCPSLLGDKVLQELEILKQQTSSSQNEMVELKQRIEGLEKLLSLKKRRKKYIGTLSSEWHRTKNEVIAN